MHRFGRIITLVIVLLLLLMIFASYTKSNLGKPRSITSVNSLSFEDPKYLINTPGCKIPDLDPFNSDVLPFVHRETYSQCFQKPMLTFIERTTNGEAKLKMNESVMFEYSYFNIRCCYSYILRKDADEAISFSSCKDFTKEVLLEHSNVKVICRTSFGMVYHNVHTAIITQDIRRNTSAENNRQKLKILMLGIDSVSRLNLQRTMPNVFTHLERHFIGFRGYNKIEDNTFPNLMAILTGRSWNDLDSICDTNNYFDHCDIMWKRFKEHGFITAYAEDEPSLSTFNFLKKGFLDPPTNIYLRPYTLAAYLLPIGAKYAMGVCTGPENTAERLLRSAKDFLSAFKNESIFGFYWLNSFSHDNVNFASSMDDKLVEFLTDPVLTEAGEDTIMVLLSDHGFRFGDIRFTYSGWLEERLPFLYVKFPQYFRKQYPNYVENFSFNAANRLVTPFDLHMTLQHLLHLVDHSYVVQPSPGCPNCNSLFEAIKDDRTCTNVGIPLHYCTCDGYTKVSSKRRDVLRVADYIVDQVNKIIRNFPEESHLCAMYRLESVETVGISESDDKNKVFLILLKTYPYAMFEATVRSTVGNNEDERLELLGQISRLNKYRGYSSCVNRDVLKKYCFCDSWITKVLSRLCYLFNCPTY